MTKERLFNTLSRIIYSDAFGVVLWIGFVLWMAVNALWIAGGIFYCIGG